MTDLKHLVDEVCAGVEIYFSGRTGGQYLRTAFVLCDDYSELMMKLFLLDDDPAWQERRGGGRFKSYHDVKNDVVAVVTTRGTADVARATHLLGAMAARRSRRNDFFHSTSLLDLNVTPRTCVDAFCDLLDLGLILFPAAWSAAVVTSRNLDTMELLLRLERLSFSDPTIQPQVNRVVRNLPRNVARPGRRGAHVTEFPEDMHLRLCVINGGRQFRDQLSALLISATA